MQNHDGFYRFFASEDAQRSDQLAVSLPPLLGNVSSQHGNTERLTRMVDTPPNNALRASFRIGSISPAESGVTASDYYHVDTSYTTSQAEGGAQATSVNPKRAYRQRRKDPSCDACRERKVKCDATETTSCTECSTRNVRCRFTKDTNRRMSSIKQVQDLERQLRDVREQLAQYRARDRATDQNIKASTDLYLPDIGRSPRQLLKPQTHKDLSTARAHLCNLGRGVIKPAISSLKPESSVGESKTTTPSLPPLDIAHHCLTNYHMVVHQHYPVLHWPIFCATIESLYDQDPAPRIPSDLYALILAVLGLGAYYSGVQHIRQRSEQYVRETTGNLDLHTDNIGLNQTLTTLLVSIYFSELNLRSASFVWLGSAIRIAQDKGLHLRGGQWSIAEGEMRRRIWYTLYVYDRFLAVELGRPMLISDEDCDTEYPSVLSEDEGMAEVLEPTTPSVLLAFIHVSRLLVPLARLCRSLCITNDAKRKFDTQLANCQELLPNAWQVEATGSLDPVALAPIMHFQNSRLLLHRHNMSPANEQEQRFESIARCVLIAQDTAKIVARCFIEADRSDQAREQLRLYSTSFVCTHVWRCMLFLAFDSKWQHFDTLLRYSAMIGTNKSINVSCSRHLASFLHALVEKCQSGRTTAYEEDEDLIVLLSADLQAGANGWVWTTNETSTLSSRRSEQDHPSPPSVPLPSKPKQFPLDNLSSEETQQWNGWHRIREMTQWLRGNQEARFQAPGQRAELYSQHAAALPADSSSYTDSTRARMTIASLTET